MGLTHIEATVANPANLKKAKAISLLVNSGAVYSVVPKSLLAKLGVKAHSTKTFTLADGSEIKRKIGDIVFKLDGHQAASPVIFGEKGDSTLLGIVSLEALGLLLDPIRRELRPLPMVLGYHQSRANR
jgi:predicted aspartyl protease